VESTPPAESRVAAESPNRVESEISVGQALPPADPKPESALTQPEIGFVPANAPAQPNAVAAKPFPVAATASKPQKAARWDNPALR